MDSKSSISNDVRVRFSPFALVTCCDVPQKVRNRTLVIGWALMAIGGNPSYVIDEYSGSQPGSGAEEATCNRPSRRKNAFSIVSMGFLLLLTQSNAALAAAPRIAPPRTSPG